MMYQIIAILSLAVFYAVYFGKMLLQKKKGIQTQQMARGKKRGRLFFIELGLSLATALVVVAELVSIFFGWSMLPAPLRILGAVLAPVGTAVFALSVWTMRDSWRAGIAKDDRTEMITAGIYHLSRNPAFLGFDLVYIGLLLLYFNWLLLLFTLFAILMLHLQVLEEEKYLPSAFGAAYLDYKKRVRRYFGRQS